MFCSNCKIEIPPEWKACIDKNICPACGEQLMNEGMQELLTEIKDALSQMPNDPVGLAGWLLSHYHLTKIGTGKPVVEFYGKKQPGAQTKRQTGAQVGPAKEDENLLDKYQMAKSSKYRNLLNEIVEDNIDKDDEPQVSSGEDDDIRAALDDPDTDKILSSMVTNVTGVAKPKVSTAARNQPEIEVDEEEVSEYSSIIAPIVGSSQSALEKYNQFVERGKMTRDEATTTVGRVSRA